MNNNIYMNHSKCIIQSVYTIEQRYRKNNDHIRFCNNNLRLITSYYTYQLLITYKYIQPYRHTIKLPASML